MTTSTLVFDPFSEDYYNNPYDTYRRLRVEAPVYYSEQYDFYALSRYEDVSGAFKIAPRRRTSVSATAFTVASVPRWHGWKAPSRLSICSTSYRSSTWTTTGSAAWR